MLDRNRRMAAGRTATDSEALFEMLAMRASKHKGLSERELANSFGWSPGKLRRAIAEWQADAEEEGDPDMAPERQTRPNPANQKRINGESDTNQTRINREPEANQSNPDTTPIIDGTRTSDESNANHGRISGEPEANPTRARFLIETETEREKEKEILTPTLSNPQSLSAEQERNPAPAAAPPADDDCCPAELIPVPSRAPAQAALVLLSPAPLIVADREGTPEDLLQLLNDLRQELHPRILRADVARLRALALSDKRRKALTLGWQALAKVARPEAERRALLRAGVLYVYLSDAYPAQGARNTGEPLDTLLRGSHLTDYCERGRTDAAALERVYAELIAHPIGWAPDPFDPARFRRQA